MKTSNQTESRITKKDINSVFWRAFTINASFNYERQMSQGFVYSMLPVLKKLYPDKEQMKEALKRHSEFFNVTPMASTLVMGITAAMEEQLSLIHIYKAQAFSAGHCTEAGFHLSNASLVVFFVDAHRLVDERHANDTRDDDANACLLYTSFRRSVSLHIDRNMPPHPAPPQRHSA